MEQKQPGDVNGLSNKRVKGHDILQDCARDEPKISFF